jgi:hypothetical protein
MGSAFYGVVRIGPSFQHHTVMLTQRIIPHGSDWRQLALFQPDCSRPFAGGSARRAYACDVA